MTNPVIGELTQVVNDTIGVMQSAEAALAGISARIQAAVDAALLNGATEAELAPVVDLKNALDVERTNLAAAITANSGPSTSGKR